jgi:hypothetical protein
MREICTSGSVGASGRNPRGDPTRRYRSLRAQAGKRRQLVKLFLDLFLPAPKGGGSFFQLRKKTLVDVDFRR